MADATPGRVSPARAAAFDILRRIHDDPYSHSDLLLRSIRVEALSPADRNLCTMLVMGVLRWRIALDARIETLLATGGARPLDFPVLVALEMGSFQLLLLERIPAHAAIFESVELTKRAGCAPAAGLVNAVLRKIARAGRGDPGHAGGTARALAAIDAYPRWLVERWVRVYGMEAAVAICAYGQAPPPAAIRLLAPVTEAQMEANGIALDKGALAGQARRVTPKESQAASTLGSRQIRLQDEGSQMIAELAAADLSVPDGRILDCCAAPGGKTAILAERCPESSITACDSSSRRLRAMRAALEGYGERISFRELDMTAARFSGEFHLVLCDAPCSGTGTLARNPEIRHRLRAEDLARQHARQVQILSSAMGALTAGGRLIYSTCSLEREENEAVVEECLCRHTGFRLLPWSDRIAALVREERLTATASSLALESNPAFLRTIPGIQPCDGFFAARIEREH